MAIDIPVIETERLLLRGHRAEDFDAHAAFWADPIVTRFIGGRPHTREQAWVRFLRHAGMWHAMGFGFWALTDRESGRFLGEAGFHDLKREMSPSLEGTMEAGWGLTPDMHGKGLAGEVVGAIIAWADANRPGPRMTCIIEPANTASIRVAERNGFREFDRTLSHGTPVIVFERERPR
jgi:RimJ/RimL family protein N-acetyltransferase